MGALGWALALRGSLFLSWCWPFCAEKNPIRLQKKPYQGRGGLPAPHQGNPIGVGAPPCAWAASFRASWGCATQPAGAMEQLGDAFWGRGEAGESWGGLLPV